MTEKEIQYMMEDLKRIEDESGGDAWMWFGLTEKLMLSNPLNRKAVENLTFIECSELLMLWDKRDEEMRKDIEKQKKEANRKKLSNL